MCLCVYMYIRISEAAARGSSVTQFYSSAARARPTFRATPREFQPTTTTMLLSCVYIYIYVYMRVCTALARNPFSPRSFERGARPISVVYRRGAARRRRRIAIYIQHHIVVQCGSAVVRHHRRCGVESEIKIYTLHTRSLRVYCVSLNGPNLSGKVLSSRGRSM